jgi:hypothetical protein
MPAGLASHARLARRDAAPAAGPALAGLALALFGLGCAAGGGAPPQARTNPSVLDATAPAAARAGEDPEARPAAPPANAVDRPGRLLIYSAITGHVPLDDPAAANDPTQSPAAREAARAAALEAEIAEERARQEQLEAAPESPSLAPLAPEPPPDDAIPLEAPAAPVDRDLPEGLFTAERTRIEAGEWQNPRPLEVVRRTLDADRDGAPEEVRYQDPETGALLRAEQDLDYDGAIDAWKTYSEGRLGVRVLDQDGDGRADAWERYEDGRIAQLTLDRDRDGVRDVFLRYRGGLLAERLEDANDDGTIDRVVAYEEKRRVRSEEDLTFNGAMDTWTTYAVVDGREVTSRVRRDSRDEGKPDVVEIYETSGGETRLVRREEDLNRDGRADVVSVYEKGRLVQRAISDEALAPL